jgi:hypothetical protein
VASLSLVDICDSDVTLPETRLPEQACNRQLVEMRTEIIQTSVFIDLFCIMGEQDLTRK